VAAEYFSPVSLQQKMPYEMEPDGRPRVPLIKLAQQQHEGAEDSDEESGYLSAHGVKKNLSTIMEMSERTEASPHWPSKLQLFGMSTPRPPSSTSSTSYGQVLSKIAVPISLSP
jgi:hypothetical protein